VIVAAIVLMAVVGSLGVWAGMRLQSRESSAHQSSRSTSPSASPNADAQFLAALTEHHVIIIKDTTKALAAGHLACSQLSSGVTWGPLIQQLMQVDTGIAGGAGPDHPSGADIQVLIESAVFNYCPENSGAVPPGFR
jgi:Protein of unknown function (DUF732)